jgi:uncharacterized protein YqjF (DUF2071 family)
MSAGLRVDRKGRFVQTESHRLRGQRDRARQQLVAIAGARSNATAGEITLTVHTYISSQVLDG